MILLGGVYVPVEGAQPVFRHLPAPTATELGALVQQIAEFLREEVTSPLNSRVPEMLGVLETTSRDSVKMIR